MVEMPQIATCGWSRHRARRTITSTIIATRGDRLFLCRTVVRAAISGPRPSSLEVLNVIEINPEERIAAQSVTFDLDDIDAAIAELDARYLAGEAADHAHTWSLVARCLRRDRRTRTPELTPGLGQRRSPARSSVRGRRDDRLPPRLV